MHHIKTIFIPLFVLLVSAFVLLAFSNKISKDRKLSNPENGYNIYAIEIPEVLDFCGESMPIHTPDIRERIDRELLVNTYWQSNGLLMFKRAKRYFPIIEPILKKYNIPDDFKYLVVIESGLDNVRSPAGASGFWQILKGTAREHGLEVNVSIDERYNLEKSTVVACEYLQDAYDKFGNWTMAAASYNMGKNGARRKIEKQGSNNYYNLFLNSETARYVFRIIAVKEIMENPRKYGFMFRKKDMYTMPNYTTVEVDSTIVDLADFAKKNGINYKLLKQFNPWLRSTSLPDKSRKKYILKIPTDTDLMVFEDFAVNTDSVK